MITAAAQTARPQRFLRELGALLRWLSLIALLILFFAWLESPSAAGILSPLLAVFKGFAISVALLAFAAGWSDSVKRGDRGMLFLAGVMFLVAFFELAHFLSHPAALRFRPEMLADDTEWFKVAARLSLALSLLLLSLHAYWRPFGERMRGRLLLVALGLAVLFFIVALERQPIASYAPALRLVLAGACLGAALLLRKSGTLIYLTSAAAVLGAGELIPLASARPGDLASLLGHTCRAAGYFLVFRAFYRRAIQEPYAMLADSERRLRQSEERLRLILDSTSDGCWDWNPKDGSITVNPRCAEVLGIRLGDLENTLRRWRSFVHPEDFTKTLAMRHHCVAGDYPRCELEYRIHTPSGETRWILTRAEVVARDERGRAARICGTHSDITQRKLTEQLALRTLQDNARILNATAEGIYGLDQHGLITFTNPAACRMLGQTPDELLGQDMHALIHARKPDASAYPREECPIYGTLRTGEIHHVDNEVFWRKDGTCFPVRYTSVPIVEHGATTGIVVTFTDITEERRVADRLGKLASVFQHARWGMAISDPDSNTIELANPALARMLGYGEGELSGLPAQQIYAPDNREDLEVAIRAAHQTGHHAFETRFIRKDGHLIPVALDLVAVKDESGRVLYRTANIQDITERKRAEEALRKSERDLARAQTIAQVGSWEWDFATGEVSWSEEVYKIFGVAPFRMSPHKLVKFVHAEDRAMVDAAFYKAITEMVPFDIHYRIVRGDGETRHIHELAEVEFGTGTGPLRIFGTVQDVTAARRIEEKLRRSQAKLENAQRIARVGDWDWDVANDTLSWSDAVYRIFGLSAREFGATLDAFTARIHPDDAQFVADSVNLALHGAPYSIDHRIVLPDGTPRWVHELAEVSFDADGRPTRMRGTVQDISERKQIEDELRQSRQLLRELSAHHEMVREEEKARIAREVHDELGQVLTALRMDVSLLLIRHGGESAELKERSESMKRLIDRAIQCVRDVATNLRPYALNLGIVSALEWLAEDFTKRTGVACRFDRIDQGIRLSSEREIAIFRIAQESLTNVARYAHASQVTLSLSEDHEGICVVVRDDGKGFDPDALPRAKSFGLLGIRERALMLGGRLEIQSAPGQGTVVQVHIPQSPVN